MSVCRICQNESNNTPFSVREMMFGTREVFDYSEGRACGCLQIDTIPTDMSPYYPEDYYSFPPKRDSSLKALIKRARAAKDNGNIIGRAASKIFGAPSFVTWIRRADVGLDESILDVGSGAGKLVQDLFDAGFQ